MMYSILKPGTKYCLSLCLCLRPSGLNQGHIFVARCQTLHSHTVHTVQYAAYNNNSDRLIILNSY